jgi:hypothetical protein
LELFFYIETNFFKSDIFQPDLFPDCFSGEPALTADQWLSGENAEAKTRSLEGGFVKKEAVAFNPVQQVQEKPLSEKEVSVTVLLQPNNCIR